MLFKKGDNISFTEEGLKDLTFMNEGEYVNKYNIGLNSSMKRLGKTLLDGNIKNLFKIIEGKSHRNSYIYRVDSDCDIFWYDEKSLFRPRLNLFDEDFII